MSKRLGFMMGILLVFYVNPSHANQQNFSFGHISMEQRLPGASVHCVYQDHKGLMWFAIESVGLCKYDGKKFTVYERSIGDSATLSNNFPLRIVEDTTGSLWIGAAEGLNEFDRTTGVFKRYLYSPDSKNTIPNNYIEDLHVDRYNNIWIATRKGISKYVKSQNKFYNLLIGEDEFSEGSAVRVSNFYEDSEGNIWIGSYSSGLFIINHETNRKHSLDANEKFAIDRIWLPIAKEDKQHNYAVQQICEYDDSTLLLGKIDGLLLFNRETEIFTRYKIQENAALNNTPVSAMHRDRTGKIWVGFATMGVLVLDPEQNEQHYIDARKNELKGLRSNSIRGIFEDNSGLIWVATKFQGIHTYDKRQEIFNQHRYNAILNDKINRKFVLSVLEDSKRNIWIGTKYNGLYRFHPDKGELSNYKAENPSAYYYIGDNRVECIEEDVYGNIWAGTENGVCRLDREGLRFESYDDYFIRCFASDKHGNMWIGTNSSGVFYYDVGKDKIDRFKSSRDWDFFYDNAFGTRAITITSDSLLWVSTLQSGLYKYNLEEDKLTHYPGTPDDSTRIRGNMVRGVYEDHTGKIWVGTISNGLYTYNIETGAFTQVEKKNGLPPNTIYNILQDDNKNIWMGSHEGLFMIDQATGLFTLFNTIFGLKSDIFEGNAACKTRDGLLIFGGSEGLNVFSPDEVYKTAYDAPLLISSVKVYDKVLAEDLNEYTEFSIHYDEKYISIEFTLAEYSNPLGIKYKYKLENFDDEWIESGNRNYATYTALPPGQYQFKLMAANADNIWSAEPLILKFTITSPIWRRPLFIIGGVIFLLLFATVIYVLRLRFLQRNELRLKELVAIKTQNLLELNEELKEHKYNLENIVEERTRDLEEARKKAVEGDQLKSTFLANMSHEIRTPLNAIMGLSKILVAGIPPGEENSELGEMIEINAKSLQQLIDDIIDISKIEANQIKIFKEAFALNFSLKNITDVYQKEIDLYKEFMNVSIGLEIPEKEIFLISDQIRVEQIIKNLINNSLKFTHEGYIKVGYTLITNENKKEYIRFFVRDTGVGIPEEDLDLIFNRFKKSETKENRLHGGTGLGLSISYNLTKLLGGSMWVEPGMKKGSQFNFEIPLEQEEDITMEELMQSSPETHVHNWENKSVLVVDDMEANYLVIEGILKQTNIRVGHAKNGLVAINEITERGEMFYSIVLMDIRMPGMDGFEATRRIKAYNKSIPIIAQTAYAMDFEEKEILKSGFDDYISKPINEQVLLDKMARFLE